MIDIYFFFYDMTSDKIKHSGVRRIFESAHNATVALRTESNDFIVLWHVLRFLSTVFSDVDISRNAFRGNFHRSVAVYVMRPGNLRRKV